MKRLLPVLFVLFSYSIDYSFAQKFSFSETEKYFPDVNYTNNTNIMARMESSAIAYNSINNEYLLVWHEILFNTPGVKDEFIYGLRISAGTGKAIGEKFLISPEQPGVLTSYGRDPDVVFDPDLNRYLVVWSMSERVTFGKVQAQFIDGSSGLKSGPLITVENGYSANSGAGFVRAEGTRAAYNSLTKDFIVVWSGGANYGGTAEGSVHNIFASKITNESAGPPVRISYYSFDKNRYEKTFYPSVTYNSVENHYLITWSLIIDAHTYVSRIGQLIHGSTLSSLSSENVKLLNHANTVYGGAWNIGRFNIVYNPVKNEYFSVSSSKELLLNRFNSSLANIWSGEVYPYTPDVNNIKAHLDSDAGLIYRPGFDQYLVLWYGTKLKYEDPKVSYLHGQLLNSDGVAIGINGFRITETNSYSESGLKTKPAAAVDAFGNIFSTYRHFTKVEKGSYDNFEGKIFSPYLTDISLPDNNNSQPPGVAGDMAAKLSKIKQTEKYKQYTAACENTSEAEVSVQVYYSKNSTLEKSIDKPGKVKRLVNRKFINLKVKKKKDMPKYLIIECLVGTAKEGQVASVKIGKF